MNKHEEAREDFDCDKQNRIYELENDLAELHEELKATEKAYEELKRDVKRYISLKECPKGMSIDDWKAEREALEIRLSKEGVENVLIQKSHGWIL